MRRLPCSVPLVALLLLACPGPVGPHRADESEGAGAPKAHAPTEAELLAPKVAELSTQAQAAVRSIDEALWAHWTQGAPLDLNQALAKHAPLFTRQTLETLRRAQALHVGDARGLSNLEHWVLGQMLALQLTDEDATVASVEATLTFALDGKEHRFTELGHLLAAEKSAVKRKALWAASLKAAPHLDAELARRQARTRELLTQMGEPSLLLLAARQRDLDPDGTRRLALAVLERTDDAWKATLARLARAELKLPPESLTRADLPLLLKAPAAVDAAFPRAQLASRAVQTLGALGVYGRPGLTLELAEGAKKVPLPLTVAPGGASDVRVSYRPLGGLRDQAQLLSEVGTALALRLATTPFETARLGDPGLKEVLAELLGGLTRDEGWLTEMGLDGATRALVLEAGRAERLHALRRAAATVLVHLETAELPVEEARARYVALVSRALGVRPDEAEGVRLHLDTDDFLRSATWLQATVLAEGVRASLGAGWWRASGAARALEERWGPGTSTSTQARFGQVEASLPALWRSLEPTSEGVVVAKPWTAPLTVLDGGAEPVDAGAP